MPTTQEDLTDTLLRYLRRAHGYVVASVEGVAEYDARRPLTPSGTNLLGVVKHLAYVQLEYVLECCGRTRPPGVPGLSDAAMEADEDMWLRAEESRADVLALYERAADETRRTVEALGADGPVLVPWWGEDRQRTTVGVLLVHLLNETAQHAGHLEILREGLDGRTAVQEDGASRSARAARIQEAADAYHDQAPRLD